MNDVESIERVFQHECYEQVRTRRECWERSLEGKEGEECVCEELLEKKCLAIHFCPLQAKRFYFKKNGECSKWAEAFAFGTNSTQLEVSSSSNSLATHKVYHIKYLYRRQSYIYIKI